MMGKFSMPIYESSPLRVHRCHVYDLKYRLKRAFPSFSERLGVVNKKLSGGYALRTPHSS